MIIKEHSSGKYFLVEPEDPAERKKLDTFPGLLKEGLSFFAPLKNHIARNIYTRLIRAKFKIRFTPGIKTLVENVQTLKDVPSEFIFHTKPLPHQLLALRVLYSYGSAGLLLEPGLGKTKVVLDFVLLMKFKRALIVCPVALLFVWVEEVAKHRPELKIYVVETTSWEVEKEGILSADLVIVNYNKAVILEENLARSKFDFIALDEGLIKNHTSERTKSLTRLSKGIPSRVVMSGTLVNNSPMDIFAPIRFIEPSMVGVGITKFRDRYAYTARSNKNQILGFRDVPEIRSILQACCVVMRKEEWLKSLPGKEFHMEQALMSDYQRECYYQLLNNFLLILDEGVAGTHLSGMAPGEEMEFEVNNILTVLCKLTQISNGFLYHYPPDPVVDGGAEVLDVSWGELAGEEGKGKVAKKKIKDRRILYFNEQPKANKLLEIVKDPAKLLGRRSIIWYSMSGEREIITKTLSSGGYRYLVIAGGEKDVGGKVSEFNTNPEVQFLVCQASSVNYGVTILGSDEEEYDITPDLDPKISDEIFYSTGFSLEVFLQQQDRIHRIGQTRTCRYWMLVTNSTIDTRISERLKDKMHCNREILVDIVNSEIKS